MEYSGKCVFNGIAIGRIAIYDKGDSQVKQTTVSDTQAEILRFENAKEEAKSQLAALYEKALVEVGEVNAAILEVHQMMLDDLDFVESVGDTNPIHQGNQPIVPGLLLMEYIKNNQDNKKASSPLISEKSNERKD